MYKCIVRRESLGIVEKTFSFPLTGIFILHIPIEFVRTILEDMKKIHFLLGIPDEIELLMGGCFNAFGLCIQRARK